jgi:CheY-like chemotaxis protein
MPPAVNRSFFINSLREALSNLYDPYELKRNPLQAILADQMAGSGNDLKQTLMNAINILMPDVHTPYDTKAWKVYELLNYRFIDQLDQKETAKNLLISLRTLQRLSPEAIEILAEQIISEFQVTLADDGLVDRQIETRTPDPSALDETWVKETEFLKSQYSASYIDIHQVLKEISQILQPISAADRGSVQINFPEETWLVMGQVTLLRQAVLTAISLFDNQPGSLIVISSQQKGLQGEMHITGRTRVGGDPGGDPFPGTDIPTALSNLMQILKGSLEFKLVSPGELSICLSLPVQRQFNIMVIDDNADAIRLVNKYLAHSIYTVTGVQEPERAISEIEKNKPSLVLLDVMLPNIDGWMLLSQIRRKPTISTIPVIVSTILPQEGLSISLGADGFLRKPFTQQELLTLLEAHILKNPKQPKEQTDTG